MTIQEVYEQYKIMPSLQQHMYRVSSVAAEICDHISIPVDRNAVITATLLHDMGNILKFNLDLFPEFLKPEGKDYWKNVQDEYRAKYGEDEHIATVAIAKELEVKQNVINLIDSILFSHARANSESTDFDCKIAAYSDMRVEPMGIVSLADRLADGNKRFKINKTNEAARHDFFTEMAGYLEQIETQIFAQTDLKPTDITDAIFDRHIEELRNWPITS